jgi:hypothetical protein
MARVFPSEKAEKFHWLALVAKTAKHPTLEISWRTERSLSSGDAYGMVEALFRFRDAWHGL